MRHDMTNEFVEIADRSVRETIEMFFNYPSGFHGDTGLQHFLYHRILSNAGSKIFWQSDHDSNMKTLLFQSEVYTEKKYCQTGKSLRRGRFDMAFVEPPTIPECKGQNIADKRLKAVVAFDVGRNKKIGGMGTFEAPDKEDMPNKEDMPKPGDAAKVIRDLRFGGLTTGYILEFFDLRIQNAQALAKGLSNFLKSIETIDCRIAICVLARRGNPMVWFYPDGWLSDLRKKYETFDIDKDVGANDGKKRNRVPYEEFLKMCGECNRHLQQDLHEKYSKILKLLYGGKAMTVNRRPKGLLFRIGNKFDSDGECISIKLTIRSLKQIPKESAN